MASLADFPPLFQETTLRIRQRMDADANAGLSSDDPRWIDTREGSFYFDVTQVALLEIARLWDALSIEVPAAGLALYAWGVYLDAHAAIFQLTRKAAVQATGVELFTGQPNVLVAQGTLVSAPPADAESEPVVFQTTEAGTTSNQLPAPGAVTATPGSGGSLVAGNYYYRVTALSTYGETTPDAEVSATVSASGKVTLTWPAVTGALGYNVYRSQVAGQDYQILKNVPANTYTDLGLDTPFGGSPPDVNSSAGVRLATQAIEPGIVGNVAFGAIYNLNSPNPSITAVTNEAPTEGGTEEETDDELRTRIQVQFQGQGGGNQNDYIRWALDEPGVARAAVTPNANGPGTVGVVVMADAKGDPVASTVITSLQNRLDPVAGQGKGQAPVGASVTVQTTTVDLMNIVAAITFKTGYNLDGAGGLIATRQAIVDAISAYINKLDVGETVVYDHVKAQFFTVEGVYAITSLTVNGATTDVAVSANPPHVAQPGTISLSAT